MEVWVVMTTLWRLWLRSWLVVSRVDYMVVVSAVVQVSCVMGSSETCDVVLFEVSGVPKSGVHKPCALSSFRIYCSSTFAW